MARIAGVDLPARKRAVIGLTYIYGIGRTRSLSLLHRAQVDPEKKVGDLSEEELSPVAGTDSFSGICGRCGRCGCGCGCGCRGCDAF